MVHQPGKHVQIICVHTEDPFTSICSAVESGDSKLSEACCVLLERSFHFKISHFEISASKLTNDS